MFLQIILSLAQKHKRCQNDRKAKLQQIGFCVYKAPLSDGHHLQLPSRLRPSFFNENWEVGTSGPYINYREVFARFELEKGKYVVIPATFEPNSPGKFMIRVFNSSHGQSCDISELDHT